MATRFCSDCGSALNAAAKFCSICGIKIEQVTSPVQFSEPKPFEFKTQIENSQTFSKKLFMNKDRLLLFGVIALILGVLISCAVKINSDSKGVAIGETEVTTNSSSEPVSSDLENRLNAAGNSIWVTDVFDLPSKPSGYLESLFVSNSSDGYDCKIFVFTDRASAETATSNNEIPVLEHWWTGEDQQNYNGIVLTSNSKSSECVTAGSNEFGWSGNDYYSRVGSGYPCENLGEIRDGYKCVGNINAYYWERV